MHLPTPGLSPSCEGVCPAVSQERASEEARGPTHTPGSFLPPHSGPQETYPGKQQLTQRLSPRVQGAAALSLVLCGEAPDQQHLPRPWRSSWKCPLGWTHPAPSARRSTRPATSHSRHTSSRPPPAARGGGCRPGLQGLCWEHESGSARVRAGTPQLREALRAASWAPDPSTKTKAATHRATIWGRYTGSPAPVGPTAATRKR